MEETMSTELLCVLGSPEWSTLYWTETQEGSWETVRRAGWWVYAGSYQQVSGIIYMAPLGCFHLRTTVATGEINISIIDCPSKERSFKCKSPGWSTNDSLCLSTLCQKYLSSENWSGTEYLLPFPVHIGQKCQTCALGAVSGLHHAFMNLILHRQNLNFGLFTFCKGSF